MFEFNEKYVIEKLKELLEIDSTTGYFRPIQNYLKKEMDNLNIQSEEVHKATISTRLATKTSNSASLR